MARFDESDPTAQEVMDSIHEKENELFKLNELRVKGLVKAPFTYDSFGQMIFDAQNEHVLDIRAWGMFQYKDAGEDLQDTFGKMVANALNSFYGESK